MAGADADRLGLTPGGGVDGPNSALAPRSRWRRDGWRWRGGRVGAETAGVGAVVALAPRRPALARRRSRWREGAGAGAAVALARGGWRWRGGRVGAETAGVDVAAVALARRRLALARRSRWREGAGAGVAVARADARWAGVGARAAVWRLRRALISLYLRSFGKLILDLRRHAFRKFKL